MGLLDADYQSSLRTLGDGRQAFYPYTLVRRGYMVLPEQGAVLRRYMIGAKISAMVLIVVVNYFASQISASNRAGVPIVFANYFPIILILSLYFAGYYAGLRWLTRNLERAQTDERPTIGERCSTHAKHLPWILLWWNEVVGVVFVLFGLSMAATGWRGFPPWFGLATAATGGFLVWMSSYMLWAKWAKSARRA